jgi:hypothetical protein
MVIAPACLAATNESLTVEIGTSSWARRTSEGPMVVAGGHDAFEPGTTMIEFSPPSSTTMSALPVG